MKAELQLKLDLGPYEMVLAVETVELTKEEWESPHKAIPRLKPCHESSSEALLGEAENLLLECTQAISSATFYSLSQRLTSFLSRLKTQEDDGECDEKIRIKETENG